MVGPFPLGPITGGIEAVAAYLSQGLLRQHDIDLHVVTVEQPHTTSPTEPSMHLVASSGRWRRPTFFLRERWAIASKLRRIEPDIVHVQGQNFYAVGALAASIPTVITLHGMLHKEARIVDAEGSPLERLSKLARGRFNTHFEKAALRQATDLIIISPYVATSIGQMTNARMHRIDNPVGDDFLDLGSTEVPNRLFFAGPLEPRKGIHRLLEAVALLQEAVPGAHIHIAGSTVDAGYARRLKETSARLSIDSRVRFLGLIEQEALLREYREASLIVMASEEETSPMLLQQAMAAGKAVVAPDVGGIRFIVENAVAGLVVEPDNVGALAEAIGTLLTDDSRRWTMGMTGRRIAQARFSIDAVTAKTVETYQAVLAAAGSPFPSQPLAKEMQKN